MREQSPFPNKKISAREVYKAVAAYVKETGNFITFDLKIKGNIGLHIVDSTGSNQFIGTFPNWKAYVMINNLTYRSKREKIERKNHMVPNAATHTMLFMPPAS